MLHVAETGIILVLDSKFFSSVIFHVATLMPTRDSDPGCNSKKMHIGNDFVTIVYNDSQQAVKFGRIKVRYPFAPKYKKIQVWRTGSREPSMRRFLFFYFLFFSFFFFQ